MKPIGKQKNTANIKTNTSINYIGHDIETDLTITLSIVVSIERNTYSDMNSSELRNFHFSS